jgi:hypothetical protein
MKRMLFAVAVLGLAAAGTANADWGGYQPPIPNAGQPAVQPAGFGEFNTPHTLMGLGQNHTGRAPDRYGLLPGLRRAFRVGEGCDSCGKPGIFSKGSLGGGCANGNCGNGGWGHNGGYGPGGGYGYEQPQYPPMMQGTLVFPQHQFIRSPRDYFMYEPGR